jgi:hypothetical protein
MSSTDQTQIARIFAEKNQRRLATAYVLAVAACSSRRIATARG